MFKKIIKKVTLGVSLVSVMVIGASSVASAATISNTGPGSVNLIYGNYGSSYIHNTGPHSTNVIGAKTTHSHHNKKYPHSHKHANHKYKRHVNHCRVINSLKWTDWNNWQRNCCKKSEYKNTNWCKTERKKRYCSNWCYGSCYLSVSHHNHKHHNYKKRVHVKKDYGHDYKKYEHQYVKKHYKEQEEPARYYKQKHSDNKYHKYYVSPKVSVSNTTEIDANVDQKAVTGDATVKYNTNAGHASTSGAENYSKVDIEIDNDNSTKKYWNYHVDNSSSVSTSVNQYARSGDATVYGNTNAGSATTGDATNSSTLEISISNKN